MINSPCQPLSASRALSGLFGRNLQHSLQQGVLEATWGDIPMVDWFAVLHRICSRRSNATKREGKDRTLEHARCSTPFNASYVRRFEESEDSLLHLPNGGGMRTGALTPAVLAAAFTSPIKAICPCLSSLCRRSLSDAQRLCLPKGHLVAGGWV